MLRCLVEGPGSSRVDSLSASRVQDLLCSIDTRLYSLDECRDLHLDLFDSFLKSCLSLEFSSREHGFSCASRDSAFTRSIIPVARDLATLSINTCTTNRSLIRVFGVE